MALKHVNVVVVGAGAGGGIAAKELSEAGLSVVLLERGGWPHFWDHDHDELISQRTTPLGNAFGPDDERYRRVIVKPDGSTQIVLPSEGAYCNNAACVGSGTVSYGAMAWRFMQKDFMMRSTYGAPEGSTLEDWPIGYEDLEPYYEKAEWEIGVAGDDSQNPFAPPRRRPQPMPPFPYNTEGKLLDPAARRLGWHPFPIPMLRNSIPYAGRPACIHCRYCVGFACEVNAKCGTHNTVIPAAVATGNCEVRTGCVASEIILDGKGRAGGVLYFDENDRQQRQTSDILVLACSATETPRIDVVAVEAQTSVQEALSIILEAGHSRLPVYTDNIDNIVGLLYAKDLLAHWRDGGEPSSVQPLVREVYFVPETKPVSDLLRELQTRKLQIAIVVDEYGGMAGLVTIEDVLEEIVGEIQDEYDSDEFFMERITDHEYIFNARADLDDINHIMSINLPTEENDTLGGLVYAMVGRVPEVGDSVEVADTRLTVLAVDGRRIGRVKIQRAQGPHGRSRTDEHAKNATEKQKPGMVGNTRKAVSDSP